MIHIAPNFIAWHGYCSRGWHLLKARCLCPNQLECAHQCLQFYVWTCLDACVWIELNCFATIIHQDVKAASIFLEKPRLLDTTSTPPLVWKISLTCTLRPLSSLVFIPLKKKKTDAFKKRFRTHFSKSSFPPPIVKVSRHWWHQHELNGINIQGRNLLWHAK